MPEVEPDFIFEVLAGRETASPEQLADWRDGTRRRLDELIRIEAAEQANGLLADAYRARLREACARGREEAELILARLDQRLQAAE